MVHPRSTGMLKPCKPNLSAIRLWKQEFSPSVRDASLSAMMVQGRISIWHSINNCRSNKSISHILVCGSLIQVCEYILVCVAYPLVNWARTAPLIERNCRYIILYNPPFYTQSVYTSLHHTCIEESRGRRTCHQWIWQRYLHMYIIQGVLIGGDNVLSWVAIASLKCWFINNLYICFSILN